MNKNNKILLGIILVISMMILVACTNNINEQGVEDKAIKDEIIEKEEEEKINQNTDNIDNESRDIIEKYEILQGDNISYFVLIKGDAQINDFNNTYYKNYSIDILDGNSKLLQNIELENIKILAGIDFIDVNLDGYLDIVINTGGTWNETHELYNWDPLSNNFMKVKFEGFDMLAWFEVHDGYIDNFIRGNTPEESVKEKLVWNGNNLIKESDY